MLENGKGAESEKRHDTASESPLESMSSAVRFKPAPSGRSSDNTDILGKKIREHATQNSNFPFSLLKLVESHSRIYIRFLSLVSAELSLLAPCCRSITSIPREDALNAFVQERIANYTPYILLLSFLILVVLDFEAKGTAFITLLAGDSELVNEGKVVFEQLYLEVACIAIQAPFGFTVRIEAECSLAALLSARADSKTCH